jgi:hypothetical protein
MKKLKKGIRRASLLLPYLSMRFPPNRFIKGSINDGITNPNTI